MQPGIEVERGSLPGLADGPSGKTARHFGHVMLRVAAIHPEGVKFHKFAAVVFIETLLAGALAGVRGRRLPVVEIEQHGGTLRGGQQQILKAAQHVRADRVAFITGDQISVPVFIQIDVEVVVPKIGQDLFQLAVAVYGAEELGVNQIETGDARGSAEQLNAAAEFRRGGVYKFAADIFGQLIESLELFFGRHAFESRQTIGNTFGGDRQDGFGWRVVAFFTACCKCVHEVTEFRICRHQSPVRHSLQHLRAGVTLSHLSRSHVKGFEGCQFCFQHGIFSDGFRMQLFFDPAIRALAGNGFHIPGPRPECEPVQDMNHQAVWLRLWYRGQPRKQQKCQRFS